MKRLLCPKLPKPGSPVELAESEARHATRVLRLRDGERVEAMDGQGGAIIARLSIRGERVWVKDEGETSVKRSIDQVVPITLELAVLKGDAMDWAIEKAVELGVGEFAPVLTAYTVVRVGNKGPEAFRDRWQRIADQALKQCGRLERMEVKTPIPFEQLMVTTGAARAPRLWFDETARHEATFLGDWLALAETEMDSVRLLVGPEGGWNTSEREFLVRSSGAGLQRLSLGPNVLRAETAALFSISLTVAHLRRQRSLTMSAQGREWSPDGKTPSG